MLAFKFWNTNFQGLLISHTTKIIEKLQMGFQGLGFCKLSIDSGCRKIRACTHRPCCCPWVLHFDPTPLPRGLQTYATIHLNPSPPLRITLNRYNNSPYPPQYDSKQMQQVECGIGLNVGSLKKDMCDKKKEYSSTSFEFLKSYHKVLFHYNYLKFIAMKDM